ncbi:GPW/gp25 family protein [Streptomyces sp. NPDC047981]|uniref:GPW/gp25 family protein n=1 Tax=Streptomyces sp. NPDC047981 TaxID=3154610 RepID=UPI003416A15A
MDGEDFIGTGWAFPLGVGGKGSVRMVTGNELLEQSMRLILTTYPGERPMRPGFGSRLRDYVFAGTDPGTLVELSHEVTASLAACEPRVTVEAVGVEPDPYNPTLVNIVISYTAKGTNDPRNMVFPFYSLPDEDNSPADQDAGEQ